MPHNPVRVFTHALPAACNANDNIRVVLSDVVQIVGDTFAHIQRGVSFQLLQHRQDRGRVALEHRQRLAPGQAWPAAFAGQPPHMLIVMPRPLLHLSHHPLRVTQHKRPDGKLS
ncbi:hypothetical protein D3C75_925030 [compost metagenome]